MDTLQPCHPQFKGSEAAHLLEDIEDALTASTVKAKDAVETAEHRVAAVKTGTYSLSEKVDKLEGIVLDLIAAIKMQCSTIDAQAKPFKILLRRIKQMQDQIDTLSTYMASVKKDMRDLQRRMSRVDEESEARKASILMGQGSYTFATLLQKFTFKV